MGGGGGGTAEEEDLRDLGKNSRGACHVRAGILYSVRLQDPSDQVGGDQHLRRQSLESKNGSPSWSLEKRPSSPSGFGAAKQEERTARVSEVRSHRRPATPSRQLAPLSRLIKYHIIE